MLKHLLEGYPLLRINEYFRKELLSLGEPSWVRDGVVDLPDEKLGLDLIASEEGSLSVEELVEDDAEGPDVDPLVIDDAVRVKAGAEHLDGVELKGANANVLVLSL